MGRTSKSLKGWNFSGKWKTEMNKSKCTDMHQKKNIGFWYPYRIRNKTTDGIVLVEHKTMQSFQAYWIEKIKGRTYIPPICFLQNEAA